MGSTASRDEPICRGGNPLDPHARRKVVQISCAASQVDPRCAQYHEGVTGLPLLALASISDVAIDEPYFYLSIRQRDWCIDSGLEELADHLPLWVPQRLISLALYGEEGTATVAQTLTARGPWVWAGELSNVHETFAFDEPDIVIDGVRVIGGPEAYFQLAKSEGMPDHADAVAAFAARPSPGHAYVVGRTHSVRPDWEDVKVEVMRRAVTAKFAQSRLLRALLRSTGAHRLVQLKPYDHYWGTGADGRGRNELGVILEELRGALTAD